MNSLKSPILLVIVLIVFTLTSSGACTSPSSPMEVGETPTSRPLASPRDGVSKPKDEQTVIIRFACPAQDLTEFEALAASFHAQTPSIRVEVVTIEDILTEGHEDLTRKLVSAVDTAYFLVDLNAVPSGLLRDLTPFIETDTTFEPEDFFSGTLEAFRMNNGTWALPSQVWLSVLYYDKQIFDQAGVSYPKLDWTQEDFVAIAQQLTLHQNEQIVQYGFVDKGGQAIDTLLSTLVGDLSESQTPLNAPIFVETVRWYTNLALHHHVMPSSSSTQEAFDQAQKLIETGKAAMWSDGLFDLDLYRPSRDGTRDMGLALFPTSKGPAASGYMYGYMMSAGTEYPQESWRWLRFLSRQRLLGPGGFSADLLPARRSVAEQSGYWNRFDEETTRVVRYAVEHLSLAPGKSEKKNQLHFAVTDVFEGTSVEEALAEAQAAFQEWLAQANQAVPIPVVVATPRPAGAMSAPKIAFAPPPGANIAIYRTLAKDFNQTGTNLQVQIVNPNQIEQADCFAYFRSVDDTSTRANLLNLQPFLDADTSFDLDDFYPRFLDALRYQGDLWGLPFQARARVIFYNPDLFDTAGVPYPEPGWTLDDLLTRGVKLTQGNGDEKQYGFLPLNGDASDLQVFIALQGVSLWDERDRPRFDTSEVVTAVRWYADLALDYGVMPAFPDDLPDRDPATQEARNTLIREGRVAMWTDFTGLDRSDVWPPNVQVRMASLPIGANKVTDFLYEGLFISADTPHPQVCWEWLKFASTQAALVRELPARRSIFESEVFAKQVGQDVVETYRALLEYAQVRMPATAEASAQLYWLHQALADILTGARPEIALTEAQRQAEK